jgi:probable F420-dependent oxidoreductase
MRLGTTLLHMGRLAGPAALVRAAQHAEALGFDTLWAADRLLSPVAPRTPYPATPDGRLPAFYQVVLDPLESLTCVAAHTRGIGLGTAVLDIPFYNPVVLARRLTTLDVLSGGRLRAGFGLGWSEDEFEAAGAVAGERGARADEFLQVLKAVWTSDPVEFRGRFYRVPRAIIGPKPVQTPHPPLYLAAFAPPALRRAARLADGWLPAGLSFPALEKLWGQLRELCQAAGRDPAALELILGAFVRVTPAPLGADRHPFTGTEAQVRADVARARALGASELLLMLSPEAPDLDSLLRAMERCRELAG